MAKISFEWEDCWAIYPDALPETQKDILIALEKTLVSVSPTAQKKALEAAPMDVIKKYGHLLRDKKARKALGLEETKSKSFIDKQWSYFG